MTQPFPILEFDPSRDAALEPSAMVAADPRMPTAVVMCFFQDAIIGAVEDGDAVMHLGSEIGSNPIYVIEHDGHRVAIVHPGVGAPLAAAFMEELIALGGRVFVACGGAGVLDSSIAPGHVVIPTSAVRDEGTSYHYLPPAREVETEASVIQVLTSVLDRHGQPHDLGKTWTTDAVYRETRGKIAARRDEGCLTVEMETAAFLAVAQFRGVTFGQYLYGGDDVGSEVWDGRGWQVHSIRERLLDYAIEAAIALS